jgi:phosphoribosylglycinamide formyltransferase-1
LSKLGVGVLISGRGSNMEALAEACAADDFPAEVRLVLSNRPDASGLEKAASFGIPTAVVDHREFQDKAAFERAVIAELERQGVELICLAGFMRVLSADFVERFPMRILNIHPSLLPSFPGLHVQQQAVDHGVRYSGCTVHFVVPEVDAGPIIVQAVVPIEPDDTAETLAARILEQEHRIYPEAVRLFAEGRLRIEGRRVRILDSEGDWRRRPKW